MPDRVITSEAFLKWLDDAGIIPARTRRVVIEASVGTAVKIYVEQFGTEALITVNPPPDLVGAQIVIAGPVYSEDDAEAMLDTVMEHMSRRLALADDGGAP